MGDCACGCGAPAGSSRGRQARYANGHYDPTARSLRAIRQAEARGDFVDAVPVREAVRRYKTRRNLTWDEVARIVGWSPGRLTSFVYGRRAHLTVPAAKHLLGRLAGLATTATPYEARRAAEIERRWRTVGTKT
jgi:transcriptional regulator with XRE-family HTH domain